VLRVLAERIETDGRASSRARLRAAPRARRGKRRASSDEWEAGLGQGARAPLGGRTDGKVKRIRHQRSSRKHLPSRRDLSADLPVDFFAARARGVLARGPLLRRARPSGALHRGGDRRSRCVHADPILVSKGWQQPVAAARADKALSVRARLRRESVGARRAARHRRRTRRAPARLLAAPAPAKRREGTSEGLSFHLPRGPEGNVGLARTSSLDRRPCFVPYGHRRREVVAFLRATRDSLSGGAERANPRLDLVVLVGRPVHGLVSHGGSGRSLVGFVPASCRGSDSRPGAATAPDRHRRSRALEEGDEKLARLLVDVAAVVHAPQRSTHPWLRDRPSDERRGDGERWRCAERRARRESLAALECHRRRDVLRDRCRPGPTQRSNSLAGLDHESVLHQKRREDSDAVRL